MKQKLIIHDLEENDAMQFQSANAFVFAAKPTVKHCLGCFGCWIKTPGKCVIPDRCAITPEMLAASNEMVIISRITYGGYSPEIKAVLDRSIGYIMPYFRIVNGEMHHTMRYQNPFKLTVHFYGEDISETEYNIAKQLVPANALNLGAGTHNVLFHESVEAIKEVI